MKRKNDRKGKRKKNLFLEEMVCKSSVWRRESKASADNRQLCSSSGTGLYHRGLTWKGSRLLGFNCSLTIVTVTQEMGSEVLTAPPFVLRTQV